MRIPVLLLCCATVFVIAAAYLLATSHSTDECKAPSRWELRYEVVTRDGQREWHWRQFDVDLNFPGQVAIDEPFAINVEAKEAHWWRMPLNDEGVGIAAPTALELDEEKQCPLVFQLFPSNCEIDGDNPRPVDENGVATWRVVARSPGEQTLQLALDDAHTRWRIADSESGFDRYSDTHGAFNQPFVVQVLAIDPMWNVRTVTGFSLGAFGLTCLLASAVIKPSRA